MGRLIALALLLISSAASAYTIQGGLTVTNNQCTIGTTTARGSFNVHAAVNSNLIVTSHNNLANGIEIESLNDPANGFDGLEFEAAQYYFGIGNINATGGLTTNSIAGGGSSLYISTGVTVSTFTNLGATSLNGNVSVSGNNSFYMGTTSNQIFSPNASNQLSFMSSHIGLNNSNPAPGVEISSASVNIDGTGAALIVQGAITGTTINGAGTGLTGTAASLTAGNVTTNANLTGPITSVGNATTIVGPVPTAAVNLSTVTTALATKAANGANSDITSLSALTTISSAFTATSSATIKGVTDGSNVAAGYVGEFISTTSIALVNIGASGSYTSIATTTITAGDWEISGNDHINVGAGTWTRESLCISLTPNACDSDNGNTVLSFSIVANDDLVIGTPVRRFSVTSNTAVYLTGMITYSVLGSSNFGSSSFMHARRMR